MWTAERKHQHAHNAPRCDVRQTRRFFEGFRALENVCLKSDWALTDWYKDELWTLLNALNFGRNACETAVVCFPFFFFF